MQAALAVVPYMNADIAATASVVNCTNIKTVLGSTIEKSMCTELFAGFWVYFLCLYCIGLSLFVVMCTISVMWEYDAYHWNIKTVRDEPVEEDDEEGRYEDTERDG